MVVTQLVWQAPLINGKLSKSWCVGRGRQWRIEEMAGGARALGATEQPLPGGFSASVELLQKRWEVLGGCIWGVCSDSAEAKTGWGKE